jgi:hypothetical protein
MEFIESMNQLSSIVGGLGKQLGSMSRNISELDKTTKTLKNTQNTFNAALSATFKTIREAQPLTTGNRNPKQNATDDALLREAANLLRMREVTEKSYKILDSSSGSELTEQDKKIEAILKGQEVIAGHLSDNPYLKKINDLHKSVQEDRDARRKGSIASKLEDFGAKSNNPLAQLIGGIGGTINSVRSAGVTLGNAGSYWLGGGRQARKAEKKLEKNRRENTRDMPLLNAYAARQMEINKLLKSGKISRGERKRLTDELSDVRGKHGAIQERIQGRSAEMAKQTVTSLSYNERRLNPKQYRSYNSDEKKYITAHLTKNVNDSFGVGKKIGSQNSLMEALGITPGETIGSKIRASKGGPKPIGSKIQASKGGPRPLTSGIELGGDAKKLHDLRAQYKSREDRGAKSTDPIMRKLMGDITRLKASSKKNTEPLRAITFGDKINATRDKRKNKSKDMWDRKFTGSIDRPSTLPEHIMSISDSMRSVKKSMFTRAGRFAKNAKVNMTGGGMGIGATLLTMLGGAIAASIVQSILKSFNIGNGSAGGAVGDDVVMKGGRAIVNKGARVVAGRVGKQAGIKGIVRATKSVGVKAGAKMAGKTIAKKIPVLGAGAGLLFAGQRAVKGDFAGAGMEALSGAASLIPGIGTAVSIGLDAVLIARDMSKNAEKDRQAQKAKIDKEYSEKYGFKSSVSKKGNIELSASRLNKKYNDAQQKEIIAKLHARMYAEEMLNGRGRNIAIRDAGINAKELSTSIVG